MEPLKLIYYFLMVISLAAFLYQRKKLGRKLFLLAPLLMLSITVESTLDFLQRVSGKRYYFVFHLYHPVEYLLLATVFYLNITSILTKRLILVSMPFYLLVVGGYYLVFRAYFHVPQYFDFVVESFLLSLWSALCIIELVTTDEITKHITFMPIFWVSFAVLLFYAGSMFIMGFRYYFVMHNEQLGERLMMIPHYLNLVFYLLLTIGFLWEPIMKKPYSA